jgi:O-antigen/teichoic acid export membrane protein
VEGALKYLALIVFPVVGGIYAIAPQLIGAYASPEYQSALYPLRVLIFSLVFTFLDFPVGALLNARMRQDTKTGIMGATLVLNVILNAILIPMYGLVGASIAALVSFVFMFNAGWIMLQGILRIHLWNLVKIVGVPAFGAVLMALTVLRADMNLYLSIVLGALVYLIVIFGSKYISIKELRNGWRESI